MRELTAVFPWLFLITAVCLVWRWRRSTEKPRALAACFAALFLFSWPPAAWIGAGTLEWPYSKEPLPSGEAGAIVVLSGGFYTPRPERPAVLLASDTYVRIRHAAWLYKNWRRLPILLCGGAIDPKSPLTLASAMREHLEMEGVPPGDLWVEDRSRTTYENALFAAELLRQHGVGRIVLVTQAYHMLRSERCFLKQGLDVIPAPCGFRYLEFGGRLGDYLPRQNAVRDNETTFHEWLGLVWYWLRGRI